MRELAGRSDARPSGIDAAPEPSADLPQRRIPADPADAAGRPPNGRERPDTHIGDHAGDSSFLQIIARFNPARAGLPEVSLEEAAAYVETRSAGRPWLSAARSLPPEVGRVLAALDMGGEHAHIRHEGWLTPEKSQLRVQRLEDPAQLDPAKRAEGIDGLRPGGKAHYCGAVSAAIRDPAAFAVAFVRGIEHPSVRAVLDRRPHPGERKPDAVRLPIASILGADGHRFCEGFQLAGDTDTARHERKLWLRDTRAGNPSQVPPPLVIPADFRGGSIEYPFRVAGDRYQVASMYPVPRHQ